jgi:hypothetical protein
MKINPNHFGRILIKKILFLKYLGFSRTHLLTNVYSLLADLVEWSDKFLFSKVNDDDKYRKIAKDLIQAVKVK